jgi:hypothetical protein
MKRSKYEEASESAWLLAITNNAPRPFQRLTLFLRKQLEEDEASYEVQEKNFSFQKTRNEIAIVSQMFFSNPWQHCLPQIYLAILSKKSYNFD